MVGMSRSIEFSMIFSRAAVPSASYRLAEAASQSRIAAQGLVEYGILIAVVAVVALASIQAFGGGIASFFGRLSSHVVGLG
jgi:Flp pilus assembly pilin Flp